MAFRTVVIKSRAKLDFCLNYLVCRSDSESRIHLSEIATLIIESTAVSITAALLSELVKAKIKVIFCDSKHLPHSQLIGYDDHYHSSKAILEQIGWSEEAKSIVWQDIIKNKIANQAKLLAKLGISSNGLLELYQAEVLEGDVSNREGHAAKVYFNLIGNDGRREVCEKNSMLNYGYSILLSAFCRAITASGMITQLGIWHKSEFNPYNLASDLMETYRVIVDDIASNIEGRNYKIEMANINNVRVYIANKWQHLDTAIDIYVKSIVKALNDNSVEYIRNYSEYEISFYESNNNV